MMPSASTTLHRKNVTRKYLNSPTPRPYLKGNRLQFVRVSTYSRWSQIFQTAPEDSPNWGLQVSKFNFYVFYHACLKHQAADALSTLPTNTVDLTPLKNDLSRLAIGSPSSTDIVVHFVDTISSARNTLDVRHVPSDIPISSVNT